MSPNQENFDSPTQYDNRFIAYRTFPDIPLKGGDVIWVLLYDALGTDYFDATLIVDEVYV
jgi:hypothetical protein